MAGTETVYPTADTGKPKSQERIVATTDGGRTWHVAVRGPLDHRLGARPGARFAAPAHGGRRASRRQRLPRSRPD